MHAAKRGRRAAKPTRPTTRLCRVAQGCSWVESGRYTNYDPAVRLIFIYGPPAVGKFTIGKLIGARLSLPLFHNHLVVDAVAALFPFGSTEFVRLREQFWLDAIGAAARSGRSLIFTFNPEPSVSDDFPFRVMRLIEQAGGDTLFVSLTIDDVEQERRIDQPARHAFGKLRSIELLRELRAAMSECEARMPAAHVTIDTTALSPEAAATAIVQALEA